jgi:branched-chain amino acid transport system substrate-binding protein
MRPLVRFLLLGACALALGCPPRPSGATLPDGSGRPRVEARKDPAADEALRRAQSEAQGEPKDQAAATFLEVRKNHPETTASQEALYQAGVLYFEASDYARSRQALNELLLENPLFEKATDARRKLATASLEVGAYRDAYQSLVALSDRAEGAEKVSLLEEASRAAEGALLFGESLEIALKLSQEARTPEEKESRLARVEELVEGKVPFVEIARVAQGLKSSDPAWPVVTFKLARIYYHVRDWQNLRDTLNRFLAEAPSHPYAQQAKDLLQRADQVNVVRPQVVGVVLPLTGRYKPVGEALLSGIKIALEKSNIELVVKDSQGELNLAGKAVEELVLDSGAIAIIGPVLADEARRAALVAEELQVPLLTLTHAQHITDIGPNVFRNMLTPEAQAKALAEYATHVLGYKTFGLLYPNISYGVDLSNTFWDSVLERGGSIRAAESYNHDQTTFGSDVKRLVGRYYLEDRTDYLEKVREINSAPGDAFRKRKAIEKVKSSLTPIVDFEALFIPDDWSRVSLVAPALAFEDIITNACDPKDLEKIKKTTGKKDMHTVTLLGTNQWSSPKGRSNLPELVERAGKFVLCSIYVDGFFADSSRPATKKFVKLFHEGSKTERDPNLLEATGYDAGGIMKTLLDKNGPKSRPELRERLASLKNFNGATGTISMNAEREADKPLFFLTIDEKGVKELSPSKKPEAVR